MYLYITIFEQSVVGYQSTDPDIRLNQQTLTTWHSASSQSKITPATTHTQYGMYTSLPPCFGHTIKVHQLMALKSQTSGFKTRSALITKHAIACYCMLHTLPFCALCNIM